MPFEPLEKLRIWQDAKEMALRVFENCKQITDFSLKNQIQRSSQSVADNIAEMYGAYYFEVKNNSLRISRKEAYETINHIETMRLRGYWETRNCEDLTRQYRNLIISINAYIKFVNRRKCEWNETRNS